MVENYWELDVYKLGSVDISSSPKIETDKTVHSHRKPRTETEFFRKNSVYIRFSVNSNVSSGSNSKMSTRSN